MKLLDVIGNLPEAYALKIKVESEGDYFGIVLNPTESLIDYKPVVAVKATVPLDLAVGVCSDSFFYCVLTFTDRANNRPNFITLNFLSFDISFYIYFNF